ncbi:SRPBCC family protein [Pseudonocardia ailaonensis]|uniref:SRPBCC family protein n=1 Tax=Pseudonocardia ailaonensis TaxID=367279 RepID=UPI0031D40A1B
MRTFTVATQPDEAIAYLADFTNAEAWDPGTVSCVRTDAGPVRVGATWHNTSKILGSDTELDYRLEHLDDTTVRLVGENKTATATDVITVVAVAGGTEVTYDATVELHGAAKLAAPLMQLEFEKLGRQTVEGIQRELGKGP